MNTSHRASNLNYEMTQPLLAGWASNKIIGIPSRVQFCKTWAAKQASIRLFSYSLRQAACSACFSVFFFWENPI